MEATVHGPPSRFVTRLELNARLLTSFLRRCGRLFVLSEMPGNVGDRLIFEGTRDLLVRGALDFSFVPVSAVAEAGSRRGSLVIPGSGAMTTLFHEWLPGVIDRASREFSRVVVLPSTFDTTVPEVAAAITHHNVYSFARDAHSYREIRALGRASLAFDPALFWRGFQPDVDRPSERSEGFRLLALRTDQGSPLTTHGLVPNPELNRDVSVELQSDAQGLEQFLSTIERAGLVVTDRLHVAVAATMWGKSVRYLDPYDEKISRYFDYVFMGRLPDSITRLSAIDLVREGLAVRRVGHE